MLSLVVIELQHRAPRVRFKHPVRVVPLDGSPRIYRTLTANLSRRGMFVRMPEPLPKGTRVALSLEAGGQALPFAEAEIAWCRTSESQLPGRFTGFGVRFTSFLNPRAPELVEYLVKNLDRGRPLKMAPTKSARRRRLIGLAAGVLALVAAGGLGARALLHWATADDEAATPEVSAAVAPVTPVVKAPVARTESAVEPPTALAAADDVAARAPAEVAPSPVDSETAPVPVPAAVAEPTDAEPTSAIAPAPASADGPAPTAAPADEASAPTIAGADLAPAAAKATSADEAPAPTSARAELAPKAVPADEAPAPTTGRAELAPKAVPADEAPTTARAGLAPKAMPAEPAPAPKIAAAKSKPGASAQGRLALPSGAAQTLSWEERGGAIHVGLALAPGATVGRRFLLAGPPRLVMDLDGQAPKKSLTLEAKAPWLKQVRIGPHGASTRVVVDLASPPAQMTQGEDGVTLTFAR